VRSERLLKERLDYNLVFGWFVGLNGRHHLGCTVFTKNRERSMGTLPSLLPTVLQQAQRSLLSDEHFTVDGTLLEASTSRRVMSARVLRTPFH
jgi:transposase